MAILDACMERCMAMGVMTPNDAIMRLVLERKWKADWNRKGGEPLVCQSREAWVKEKLRGMSDDARYTIVSAYRGKLEEMEQQNRDGLREWSTEEQHLAAGAMAQPILEAELKRLDAWRWPWKRG